VSATALGLAALASQPALAEEKTSLADLVIYAIDQDTDELIRYKFYSDYVTRIGEVVDQDGAVVDDVDALAHIATGDYKGLYAAANYDGSDTAHLARVNAFDGSATVVDTGLGEITGLVAARGTGANPITDFEISSKRVTPDDDFALRVTVLGCAISLEGWYDMPVKLQVTVDDDTYEPFGPYSTALGGGDVNDGSPHQWIAPTTFEEESSIKIRARSYAKYSTSSSGAYESHWYVWEEAGSSVNSSYLMVLRDGDPVPPVEGFLDQDDLVDFVKPFVDPTTNTMKLGDNQAIYCFELGAPDLSHPAADFQDCVVLVSLADDPAYFYGAGEWVLLATAKPEAGNDDTYLVLIDPVTGASSRLMKLDGGKYEDLTVAADGTLLAVYDDELWEIDLSAGEENPVGEQGLAGDVRALAYAFGETSPRIDGGAGVPASWTSSGMLFGFSPDNNKLIVVNPNNGDAREIENSFNQMNVEGFVFMSKRNDTWGWIIADAHD
jgi:hypothetical protein